MQIDQKRGYQGKHYTNNNSLLLVADIVFQKSYSGDEHKQRKYLGTRHHKGAKTDTYESRYVGGNEPVAF